MLYMIYKRNHEQLIYRKGQDPILHLESDLYEVVNWANQNDIRWAFTTTNASTAFFDDFASLSELNKIDWKAVNARFWRDIKDAKQAEFLLEGFFPWALIRRIGARTERTRVQAVNATIASFHRPPIELTPRWYY